MRPDRSAALLCARVLGRTGLLDSDGAIPVLMYHSVSRQAEDGVPPYYRLSTSPARFREHMRLLAHGGYTVTSLAQAIETTRLGRSRKRQVVVTFDDGYLDFFTEAWPALEALSFTATVFLPTAFIGGHTRLSFKGRECLTWSEVRDLSQRGVSFGSHTITHPVLHVLPWSQVRSELRESRERIEQVLGTPVTTFAYPFAFPQHDREFVSRFCEELHEQGYRASVTTAIGRLAPGADPLRIKRLPVNDSDDPRLLAAKLAGAYDWLGALQSAWKRVPVRPYRPATQSSSESKTEQAL